jgi:hypothetical protein
VITLVSLLIVLVLVLSYVWFMDRRAEKAFRQAVEERQTRWAQEDERRDQRPIRLTGAVEWVYVGPQQEAQWVAEGISYLACEIGGSRWTAPLGTPAPFARAVLERVGP